MDELGIPSYINIAKQLHFEAVPLHADVGEDLLADPMMWTRIRDSV